jgi:hypothetical protein
MNYWIFFIAFVTSNLAWSQQVRVEGTCVGKLNKALGNVQIKIKQYPSLSLYSDKTGDYSFEAKAGDTLLIQYSIEDLRDQVTVIIKNQAIQVIPKVIFAVSENREVIVQYGLNDPFTLDILPPLKYTQMVNVEKALVYSTAATSNNELTSNYNVRGGNYDENLVYVNGFLVYRPFLTRSGQQEGMSFIHSSLVESVRFSAGGFDAQYGDRLSSVLDITYRTPDSSRASSTVSLLGIEAHAEQSVSPRFNYLVGARYRSNGYFLNSLPTKGAYNPVFADAQILTNYSITEKLTFSLLGHFSSNAYRFSPQSAESDFGTANEAYRLMIYYDGKEATKFQTAMGGASLKFEPNKKTNLDFYISAFNTNEREYFDIQGQYYINQLETDPSKEEYGDSIATLGVGTFLNHARNRLNATILSAYHNGSILLFNGYTDDEQLHARTSSIKWGAQVQRDFFTDVLSEWRMIDSAGYSLPQANPQEVTLYETIKGDLNLTNYKFSGFTQWNLTWSTTKKNYPVKILKKFKTGDVKSVQEYSKVIKESNSKFALATGLRGGYTAINHEPYFTPRFSLTYFPRAYMVQNNRIVRRNLSYRLSSGLYYQPPFYREFRTFDGKLNLNVRAQKSMHVVAATDLFFEMWGREKPFKFTGELYYKYLWDVNPYEIENVRTRYYADNNAVAYAYGIDMNVHGEFVKGIESFFKVGLMRTREDILNDRYTEYFNAAGERIVFGYSQDQVVVDSNVVFPGYVPRPTDQLLTIGALVQDQMPGFEQFSVQMGLQFGSRLPYGPPDFTRYKDTLRMKSYFRVDLALSYDLLKGGNAVKKSFLRKCEAASISLEIFNLLGINNVLSKQWIQDVEGKYYAIPNYLTSRRFNLKLSISI